LGILRASPAFARISGDIFSLHSEFRKRLTHLGAKSRTLPHLCHRRVALNADPYGSGGNFGRNVVFQYGQR
jgi:hypothetical protein